MTKELSKQLCELCGIKPKIKCHPWECPHVGYYKRDKCIINFKPDEECVKRRDLSGYISYPDFGKPENFVKLFKLITTIEGYVYRTGFYYIKYIPTYKQLSCLSTDEGEYSSENTDPIKAFITCVIKCARAEKDTADYIREAEWVYD